MNGIRNDNRPDTRTDTRTRTETGNAGCAKPPPPPAAPPPPQVLSQPDLDQRAAAARQLGTADGCRDVPPPPAAAPLNYDALLTDAPPDGAAPTAATTKPTTGEPPMASCPRGAAEAGTPTPAEMKSLERTQQAVVDAGVALFAASNGMTIAQLAEQFDTNAAEIERINPGLAETLRGSLGRLTADQNVNVPVGSSTAPPPATTADAATTSQFGARYGVPSPSADQVRAGSATMGRGMGGASVRDMQTRLNAMGANLAVDGKFGPATEAALKAFQSSNGIQQTGVLGRQTLAALDNPQARRISAEAAGSGGSAGKGATTGPAATTSAGNLTGSAFGNQVAAAAERSARQLNSVGRCALGVNNALTSVGVEGRGHAYQKAEQLERNSRFREVNVSASDLRSLPPGAVVVWGRSAAKPWGHVSVALGGGREASDHLQNQITGGRYGTDFGNGPDSQGRQFRVFLPR